VDDLCSIYSDRPDICRRFVCLGDAEHWQPRGFWSGEFRRSSRNFPRFRSPVQRT
jgi:Fe-S-cluster containining protein